MGILKNKFGQPSYSIKNEQVEVFISVQGGHLTANFKCEDEWIDPFFYAPWGKGNKREGAPWILHILRGDPFCFPFGSGIEAYQEKKYAHHGKTANSLWDFLEYKEKNSEKKISLIMDLDYHEGKIEKSIYLQQGHPVIYNKHIVQNFSGRTSLGHHPILYLPFKENSAFIDLTEPVTGFSTPIPAYHPRDGEGIETGYSWIKHNQEITDRKKIKCIDNSYFDLTRFPIPKGYAEIVMFISDQKKDYCFSSVSVPEKGYCYFQLKDPKILTSTMFWISNGGQINFPTEEKIDSVLAIEEMTGYFHYGRKKSVEKNSLNERGFSTYLEIKNCMEVNLINGIIPIDKDFTGVKDIVKKNSSCITIIGKGGEHIDVPCHVDFLKQV